MHICFPSNIAFFLFMNPLNLLKNVKLEKKKKIVELNEDSHGK